MLVFIMKEVSISYYSGWLLIFKWVLMYKLMNEWFR